MLSQAIPAAPPAAPTAETHSSFQMSIVWDWNTVSSATGYKWNNINEYETATDMGTNTSHNETGLYSSTEYTSYVWAYNGCGYSAPATLTQSTLACWDCGNMLYISHVTSGGVAPVDKTVTYGTVINIPGETSKCWITSNLGANHQATSVEDATEASAGWYWQFNRMQGYKHDGSTRTPNTTWIASISDNSDWITANDPCALELGSGWRLPTYTEYYNVDDVGGWTGWNGPWNSALKMHAAGCLYTSDGSIYHRGMDGYYWSVTQWPSSSGWNLYFTSGGCGMDLKGKAFGYSVRCVGN